MISYDVCIDMSHSCCFTFTEKPISAYEEKKGYQEAVEPVYVRKYRKIAKNQTFMTSTEINICMKHFSGFKN